MKTRLATTITILAGLLMVAAIACSNTPASPAPTQTPTAPTAPTGPTDLPTPDPGTPPGPTPDVPSDDPDHKAMLERAHAELDKYRALWEAAGSGDYTFEYTPICFCPRELVQPVTIFVRDGAVESITYVASGEAPADDGFPRYLSIDGLFDLIQEAIDRAPRGSRRPTTQIPDTRPTSASTTSP